MIFVAKFQILEYVRLFKASIRVGTAYIYQNEILNRMKKWVAQLDTIRGRDAEVSNYENMQAKLFHPPTQSLLRTFTVFQSKKGRFVVYENQFDYCDSDQDCD